MPKIHLFELFIAIVLALLQNSLSAKNNADIIAHAINVYSNYTCAVNKLFVSFHNYFISSLLLLENCSGIQCLNTRIADKTA